MVLYHITPRCNASSIKRKGLRIAYAGASGRIWFVTRRKLLSWGLPHIARHYGVTINDLAIIRVNVPRSWVTHYRPCVWRSKRDVPADRLEFRVTL